MDPIYKLFTGNYIDMDKILDVGNIERMVNTVPRHIRFAIQFQLMDKWVVYYWYLNGPDEKARELETVEFHKLYDNFISDWKKYKSSKN